MAGWSKEPRTVKIVDEVKCYMDGSFSINRHDGFDMTKYDQSKPSSDDPYFKTFVLSCGTFDGEYIDLFELQKWFDANREWINSLRKEIE